MELFAIHCTTCKARLIVKDESAIGDILSCPKCHSMVQVIPPPGWTPPTVATSAAPAANIPPAGKTARASAAPTARAPAKSHATPAPAAASATSAPAVARAAAPPALPPRVNTPAAAAVAASSAQPVDTAAPSSEPAAEITSAAKPRDWTLITAGIGGGVLLGAVAWLVIWLASPDEVTVAANSTPAVAAPEQPAAPQEKPAAVETTPAPANEPSAPAASPIEAQPQPAPNDAVVAPSPAADIPTAEASVPPASTTASPAAAPAVEQPPAAADAQPELKLDPVAPQPVAPTDPDPATDSLGEAAAADGAPADNTDAEPSADENLPAAVEASPGEPAPLPVAEIQRRLGVPLSRVDFSGVPLGHLAAFLSDVSGARIVIDETSLAKSGKSRKTPVTVKLTGGTALAILEAAAEQAGLDYKIEPGRITLSARGP